MSKVMIEPKNKSISKTLAILSTFTETHPMQRTSDIANKLEMNISTVSRHLNTLFDGGYLERDEHTGYYYPGLKIVALAGTTLHNRAEYRYSYPQLVKISNKYQVHSHMGVLDGQDVVHLISSSCESTKDLFIPMGHRNPLYCSAMGRAILAYIPTKQSDDLLKSSQMVEYTPETCTDIEMIKLELKEVKGQGYAVVKDELAWGKASLAAPIFNRNRDVIGAISVSLSVEQLEAEGREFELARVVKYTAGKISGQLGYYPV